MLKTFHTSFFARDEKDGILVKTELQVRLRIGRGILDIEVQQRGSACCCSHRTVEEASSTTDSVVLAGRIMRRWLLPRSLSPTVKSCPTERSRTVYRCPPLVVSRPVVVESLPRPSMIEGLDLSRSNKSA